ncbi:MAG TPA: hypothetical protein VM582_05790 [Candidatus Thermoplasmatota archaeon]|nr:hypothetical protein [Candidatus Thermoplasmatota archaeon]
MGATRAIVLASLLALAALSFVPPASAVDCRVLPDQVSPNDLGCVARCTWEGGGAHCVTRYLECPPTC